ncbi:MAG: CDP-alcohol phosphatidyltransferase family protein [Rhizobiales bacterium]|nr:CDP-alcohol phosphatidyltransferase family protein [Hyphomicrobiales bacterium]
MKALRLLNLPNIITIGRIFIVPVVVWVLLADEFLISLILFIIAGISDFIDGWLARLQNLQTLLGAYLDPFADKLLMGSVYLTLGILGHIPIWLVLCVIFRDILIVSAIIIAWLIEKPLRISPLLISKINTVSQICLVVLTLFDLAFIVDLIQIRDVAYLLIAGTTIASTFAYLIVWVKIINIED